MASNPSWLDLVDKGMKLSQAWRDRKEGGLGSRRQPPVPVKTGRYEYPPPTIFNSGLRMGVPQRDPASTFGFEDITSMSIHPRAREGRPPTYGAGWPLWLEELAEREAADKARIESSRGAGFESGSFPNRRPAANAAARPEHLKTLSDTGMTRSFMDATSSWMDSRRGQQPVQAQAQAPVQAQAPAATTPETGSGYGSGGYMTPAGVAALERLQQPKTAKVLGADLAKEAIQTVGEKNFITDFFKDKGLKTLEESVYGKAEAEIAKGLKSATDVADNFPDPADDDSSDEADAVKKASMLAALIPGIGTAASIGLPIAASLIADYLDKSDDKAESLRLRHEQQVASAYTRAMEKANTTELSPTDRAALRMSSQSLPSGGKGVREWTQSELLRQAPDLIERRRSAGDAAANQAASLMTGLIADRERLATAAAEGPQQLAMGIAQLLATSSKEYKAAKVTAAASDRVANLEKEIKKMKDKYDA